MTATALAPAPPALSGGDRLLAIITGLFLSGRLVAHDDADFHRAHIAWEFCSGQWAMLTDDRDRLMGWLSWYRVDDAALAALRDLDIAGLIALGRPEETLTTGRHLYIATVAIVPGAPADAFNRLCRMAARLNPEVETVSWHHRYPDGHARFVQQSGDHRQNGVLTLGE